MNILQQYIHLSRYARFIEEEGRRENFDETVDRYLNFFKERATLPQSDWDELRAGILNLDVMPSMRALMSAGPALARENLCGYNCSYVAIDSKESLSEILYILMCGTGVGFSVERQVIAQLPSVPESFSGDFDEEWCVGDSKEGWAEAFQHLLSELWQGRIPAFDFTQVRPAGARLKTMGGRASGPAPLRDLFHYTIDLFKLAAGRKLRSIELHDLACKIGEIVVVGGVRRSAMISLSNLSDDRMREAKSGNWWGNPSDPKDGHKMRAMANNSAVYTEKPEARIFMKEWLSLVESNSGERGIVNREAAKRKISMLPTDRDPNYDFGLNPCAEILLRSKGLCNLSEVVCREGDELESLKRKVRLATIIGTLQSTLTDFKFVRPDWKENAEQERLLGVSLTGILDVPYFRLLTSEDETKSKAILTELRNYSHRVNLEYAEILGIKPSKAVTCVKPSGTVSLLVDCAPGIHPGYGKHYIRRVRNDMKDPMTKFLVEQGVTHEPAEGKPDEVMVFSFPCESSGFTIDELTALQHCKIVKFFSDHWTDHNPSSTITVREHEWPTIGAWVWENFDSILGMSFLPWFDNTSYNQLPIEPVSEEVYLRLCEENPTVLDWHLLAQLEAGKDNTDNVKDLACIAGVCSIV